MKKLLSIITALTVAASATSSLVSCKVITNEFKIEITEWKNVKNLKYAFNKEKKQYEVLEDEKIIDSDVKKSLDGITGNLTSTIVNDMINSLFFNSDLSVTKNSIKTWQYLFETDNGTYADGQFRTAGFNSTQKDEIQKYYSSTKNISSLLGLMQYSKWSNIVASDEETAESGFAKLDPKTVEEIEKSKIFESSANQGITNVKIKSTPTLYSGEIGLAEKNGTTDEETDDIKISAYDKKFISESTNYDEEMAEKESGKGGYADYTVGIGTTAYAYDYSQLLVSNFNTEDIKLPVTVRKVKEQSNESKENFQKQGLILNKENSKKQQDEIIFEYTEDEKGNKNSYAYGYSLVPLDPIKMEIELINDRDLKTGKEKPESKYYVIDLTIDGLNAAFKPILGFTSYKNEKGESVEDKSGIPFVGWRFAGYQFNSSNIVSYNDDGTVLTAKAPNKKMAKSNKKFNDFNITSLTFKEVEKPIKPETTN
ncbi:hypothetical protein [Mesoplasma coleopterae]|uniref:hypothetical protein n=1 Tax=Mesoplasma coleopterae TaxID=324078 RepID=UPI000D03F223|nr:hypothetical protein [Mesoplasma coleopterae]AVN62134.1 hypothetical protein CG001_00460 [Mesoplasma coleopterae]AVN62798.1 hypothetical protein CG000_00510 [Mesoplasma coleopterae]